MPGSERQLEHLVNMSLDILTTSDDRSLKLSVISEFIHFNFLYFLLHNTG